MTKVTKAIGWFPLQRLLGTHNSDTGVLCTSNNINKWAKNKPIDFNTWKPLSSTDRINENQGFDMNTVIFQQHKQAFEAACNAAGKWPYVKAGTRYNRYRIFDFDGYDTEAEPPFKLDSYLASLGSGTTVNGIMAYRLNTEDIDLYNDFKAINDLKSNYTAYLGIVYSVGGQWYESSRYTYCYLDAERTIKIPVANHPKDETIRANFQLEMGQMTGNVYGVPVIIFEGNTTHQPSYFLRLPIERNFDSFMFNILDPYAYMACEWFTGSTSDQIALIVQSNRTGLWAGCPKAAITIHFLNVTTLPDLPVTVRVTIGQKDSTGIIREISNMYWEQTFNTKDMTIDPLAGAKKTLMFNLENNPAQHPLSGDNLYLAVGASYGANKIKQYDANATYGNPMSSEPGTALSSGYKWASFIDIMSSLVIGQHCIVTTV